MKHRHAPTSHERAALTRIYGNEENWLWVATVASKKRQSDIQRQKRQERNAQC